MAMTASEAWRQLQQPPTYKTAVKHCLAALQVDAQQCVHRYALDCTNASWYKAHQLENQAPLSILPDAAESRTSCSPGQAPLSLQQVMQSLSAYSKSTRSDALKDLQVRFTLCWFAACITSWSYSTLKFPACCRFAFMKTHWNSLFLALQISPRLYYCALTTAASTAVSLQCKLLHCSSRSVDSNKNRFVAC